jgi:Co/Zn/Cd efflux system component
MSAHCHDPACSSSSTRELARHPGWRRVLWIALIVNATMFGVELWAGWRAESAALLADAIDFAGDAVNYGLSLAVLGLATVWASRVAWLKGWMMGLYGLGVLAYAGRLAWVGSAPEPATMGLIGLLALVANVVVAALLYRYRGGDANAQSVWLCSRNDAIGNALVVLAALGVFGTGTAWPDLIVATVMAGLGVSAAVRVIGHARHELKAHAQAV